MHLAAWGLNVHIPGQPTSTHSSPVARGRYEYHTPTVPPIHSCQKQRLPCYLTDIVTSVRTVPMPRNHCTAGVYCCKCKTDLYGLHSQRIVWGWLALWKDSARLASLILLAVWQDSVRLQRFILLAFWEDSVRLARLMFLAFWEDSARLARFILPAFCEDSARLARFILPAFWEDSARLARFILPAFWEDSMKCEAGMVYITCILRG